MATQLAALSDELAAAVERVGRSVVGIHGRPRFGSSGVVWREGVIVTAEHALKRGEEIPLTLPGGGSATATVAGTDAGTDLAVLRTTAAVTPAATSDGKSLQPGHLLLAIGRSEDTGVNAAMGIASALGPDWRTWRGGRLDRYVRLDLTLFPGTTGGAVANIAGEVLGIATPVLSRIAAVAIPSTTINRVVDELLRRGHVSRGYLGVGVQPVQLPDHLKQQGAGGVGLIVLSLEQDGPASKAGVLIGDILTALDGKAIGSTDQIQAVLETRAVGQSVTASLIRGGAPLQLPIVIGERPRRSQS